VLLPLFTVAGLDHCEEDCYASDNNLRGTPRGSRERPNVGREPRSRLSTAVLCRGLEKNGMVRAWHGRDMASVNQTRPYCVNQMGKTHSKPFAARHDRETAWAWHGHGMLCVNRPSWRQEAEAPRRATQSAHQRVKVSSPTHRPPVIPILISVRGGVDPRAIVRPED
jgi:hypothetical protein